MNTIVWVLPLRFLDQFSPSLQGRTERRVKSGPSLAVTLPWGRSTHRQAAFVRHRGGFQRPEGRAMSSSMSRCHGSARALISVSRARKSQRDQDRSGRMSWRTIRSSIFYHHSGGLSTTAPGLHFLLSRNWESEAWAKRYATGKSGAGSSGVHIGRRFTGAGWFLPRRLGWQRRGCLGRDVIVVPQLPSNHGRIGPFSTSPFNDPPGVLNRYMQIYAASQFSSLQPILITSALTFASRRDSGDGVLTYISRTSMCSSRPPPSRFGGLSSPTFAAQHRAG